MPNESDDQGISKAVSLTRDVFMEIAGSAGQCCSLVDEGRAAKWVSAAEVVYDITGNPGKVVRSLISFELDGQDKIEMDLVDGSFTIHLASDPAPLEGRKAIELLMLWRKMTIVQAIEYIAQKYSVEKAISLGSDFVRMKVGQYAKR
jgi:hypothetical protein